MKRTFLLAVTALVALMAASCQKEELGRVLTATIEQYEHSGNAKAYINNDNYACWENNDRVQINNVQCTVSVSQGNEHNYTATIEGQIPTDQDLLAFYPASQVSNLTSTGGTVTLPHIQNYETTTVNGVTYQKINNPMAAYCPADSNKLKFRNLCALLKVTVQGNTYVKGIQVKGIENQMLCGTAPLKLNSQGQPTLGKFAKGSNSVVLNFAAPTEVSGSKSFYIVVPGKTDFDSITIAVLTTDATGTTYTSYCKTSFLGESLSRNNIGAINYTFQGDQDDTFTPDWMIRYTGSAQVTPNNTSAFGDANFKNGNFSNNSGYLLFDRPLTTIGNNAFQGCKALTGIDLSHTEVTSIGDNAFESCIHLKSISLPATLNSLGNSAFQSCPLTSIDLSHTGVTSIGNSTFKFCGALSSISLPANLQSIGTSAFESCFRLESISLPANLNSLGDYAFQECSALTGIALSHTGVTSIGDGTFEDCGALSSISLPANLQSIGGSAFQGCTSLSSINLSHTGVTSIGDEAFAECRSLTSISLPAGVTSIGDEAFNCCSNLTSIDLPDNLTSIGKMAFEGCRSLTSISLPAGVTSIGMFAFADCGSLAQVDCYAINPPSLGAKALRGIPSSAVLHVPSSHKDDYLSTPWNDVFTEDRIIGDL